MCAPFLGPVGLLAEGKRREFPAGLCQAWLKTPNCCQERQMFLDDGIYLFRM